MEGVKGNEIITHSTVCFIVPFFGALPETFELWLQCCGYNRRFKWVLITDQTIKGLIPENVLVNYIEYNYFVDELEKRLGFSLNAANPYKLCDLRPLYGELFKEELRSYSHWGYCDLDIIFGDIDKYITEDMLISYDKISKLGHLSIIKNIADNNNAYKECDYKGILQDSRSKAFDEVRNNININNILEKNGKRILSTIPDYYDVDEQHFCFHRYVYKSGKRSKKAHFIPSVFEYSNGKLYLDFLMNNEVIKEEISYAHFQKRRVSVLDELKNRTVSEYSIVPNMIIEKKVMDANELRNYAKDDYRYYVDKTYNKVVRAINRRIKVDSVR